ncbi:sugar O-acetyltransferase [Uliginosibacterium gangwonense]|uniref:sugar O-acetyltransferase n=1 Tax=Uliginosibacterium gangwonense TaxID=392736 RepID=UPI000378397A|nr:sugar O-acetyltransferase [Uliginosibacterium gangwonense]
MNQRDRMLAALPYKAWLDGLSEERMRAKEILFDHNNCRPSQVEERQRLLRLLLGKIGQNFNIEQPFRCDYGYNIEIGENFYANYGCLILDVAKVTIGNNVQFAPNVSILTAGHPLHPQSRNSGYEYGIPIQIGHNVWLGANVIVNPGVSIGENTVIGAGSVVTKAMPANVVAAGNPCRVLRSITDEDRKYYYKDRIFDVEDY